MKLKTHDLMTTVNWRMADVESKHVCTNYRS